MVRKLRDSKLETRSARASLRGFTFKKVGPKLDVGYRPGKRGGRWYRRDHTPGDRKHPYQVKVIAWADDKIEANGIDVLDFWQAVERVQEGIVRARTGPYLVKHAIEDYLRKLEGKGSHRDTRLRLNAFVIPKFGGMEVSALTYYDLTDWHRKLASSPARIRSGSSKPQRVRHAGDDTERKRARMVSANRILGQFRAALNHAFKGGEVPSDSAWKRVEPFRGVNAARVRYLSNDECRRLINACEGDLRVLVEAALSTGARYAELGRLKVEDFNADVGTLLIRTSKPGKSRHVILTDEARDYFAGLAAGRAGVEPLLGRKWGPNHQSKPMRQACKRAGISPPISIHGMRHTYASLAVMNGVPLLVIARNLGHSNTRMTEAHYGHLASDFVSDAIRAGAPTFGLKPGNVKAIR